MTLAEFANQDIEVIISYMKAHGISGMTFGEYSLALQDYVPKPDIIPFEPSAFEDETVQMECGHFAYEMNDQGQCLHGCVLPVPTTDVTGSN